MINPNPLTLRRRSVELHSSAVREFPHNEDSSALLLFYAAECALKACYMLRNNLRNTEEARAMASSARSYVHNIVGLTIALNIPRSSVGAAPPVILSKMQLRLDTSALHQAWRYGEKVEETEALRQWLISIIEWCRRN